MTSEDFDDRFKSYSTIELLAVLQNSEDYQTIAVEAARNELNSRKISHDDLNHLLFELEARKRNEIGVRSNSTTSKIRRTGKNYLQKINPFDYRHSEAERIIRATILWNTIIYILLITTHYKEAWFLLGDIQDQPFLTVLSLMPFIFYPISILGFALKRRLGWLMFAFFLSITAITNSWTYLLAQFRYSLHRNILNPYFNEPGATALIIPLVVAGLTLYAICKPEVRSVYKVSKNWMVSVFILSAIVIGLAIFMIS